METSNETLPAANSQPATGEAGSVEVGSEIRIRPLNSVEDAAAFRALNEEWITRFFVLEQRDRETLGDPEGVILSKGGHIFIVLHGEKRVGCVALIPSGEGVFELSKMAVSPQMRGLGIGRRLLAYAIAQARAIGARSLYLGSSTRLQNAVHLYESAGFRHVPAEQLPLSGYGRADVFMELLL